jgi:hypothetical protein
MHLNWEAISHFDPNSPDPFATHGIRPRRRAAKQRDELATPHSITSSAAACSVSGTVTRSPRPQPLAASAELSGQAPSRS